MEKHETVETKKILVVDDSEVVLLSEKIMLGGSGRYDLSYARNGAQAIEVASKELPDLILLDIIMPKMDGLTVCRALRGLKATAAIPIIMVTTRGEERNVKAGFEAGCNDYVTKPINRVELLEKIKKCLDE